MPTPIYIIYPCTQEWTNVVLTQTFNNRETKKKQEVGPSPFHCVCGAAVLVGGAAAGVVVLVVHCIVE